VAVSSKSNTQFSTTGVPKDVCRDLWIEVLNDQSAVFNKSKDFIALIVAPLSRRVFKDISELIAWASANDPVTLQKRVDNNKSSQSKKKIFNSFKCPSDLATKHKVKQSDTWVLLARLLVTEFDFEAQPSKDENSIIEICRNCLANKNRSEAESLFTKLKDLRNVLAPVSGKLAYNDVVEKFRYDHKLVGFPEHSQDWKKIIASAKSKIDAIPAQIGGKLQVQRTNALKDLQSMISTFDSVFIVGRSGTGKSILASKFTREKLDQGIKVIWVDAFSLENDFENTLRLENTVADLATMIQDSEAYIVIDGIDRFFKEPQLIHLSKLMASTKPNSSWKFIYTCQTEDFEDALKRLHRHNVILRNFKDYQIEDLDDEDIAQIISEFPAFADLFKH
jgi:DNA replication protein DnaC